MSRPPLLLMGLLGPLACLKWVGALHAESFKSLLLTLTIFCANWAWNLYNELHDKKVDAINKPSKPFPSGQVDKHIVSVLFSALLLTSFILNVFLIWFFGAFYLVGFLAHVTAFIYNGWRRDFIGNVCEVVTIGLAPFMVMFPKNLWFSPALALLFLGNALNTQFQDLKGERIVGVLTAPQQLGRFRTAIVSSTSLFTASLLFYQMYVATSYFPMLVFVGSCTAHIIGAITMLISVKSADWIIENFSRRLGRLLLIIGFLTMLLC